MRIPMPTAAVSTLPRGTPRWETPGTPAGITPSGGGKGGGSTDNPATCARSCYDCSQSGYRTCAISTTCQRRYPNNQFPVGCYR